jgi:hypothetical protein
MAGPEPASQVLPQLNSPQIASGLRCAPTKELETMSSLSMLAYLDPGAGSLLLQALVAGGGGVLVFCRHLWKSFRAAPQRSCVEE